MNAFRLEDLQVWQRALALGAAVSAITVSETFGRHLRLRAQLDDAAASVAANIAEGFGQGTDRSFASFLFIARGSANEVRAHLVTAAARGLLVDDARLVLDRELEEITRMLGGLIRYLLRSNRKDRC
jgi:four helix bundle protein